MLVCSAVLFSNEPRLCVSQPSLYTCTCMYFGGRVVNISTIYITMFKYRYFSLPYRSRFDRPICKYIALFCLMITCFIIFWNEQRSSLSQSTPIGYRINHHRRINSVLSLPIVRGTSAIQTDFKNGSTNTKQR